MHFRRLQRQSCRQSPILVVKGPRSPSKYQRSYIAQSASESKAPYPGFLMRTHRRRIDDRLRELSAMALASADEDLEPILQELLELVHAKSERLKRRAARLLLNSERLESERRASDVKEAA